MNFRTSMKSITKTCDVRTRNFVLRFEVFTAVTMKNVVFWDAELCRCGVNRVSGERLVFTSLQLSVFVSKENVFRDQLVSENQSLRSKALANSLPRNGPYVAILLGSSNRG
jgi:hypothetical protein